MTDTNILISSILFPDSLPSELVEEVLLNHKLVLCSQIIDELHEVFARKFKEKTEELESFLTYMSYELIYTPSKIVKNKYPNIRDEKDLPILVSAILAEIDVLVTGDKDFYEVEVERLDIISARKFIEKY